jgi:hypothetical protein
MLATFPLQIAELVEIVSHYRKVWDFSRSEFLKELDILNRQNSIKKLVLYGRINLLQAENDPYVCDTICDRNPNTRVYLKENKPEVYENILNMCKSDEKIYVDYAMLTLLRSFKEMKYE